jgi:tripartite-type tricarboxylate transporter receptor subunit TctC
MAGRTGTPTMASLNTLVAGLALTLFAPVAAHAQVTPAYPTRTIKFIVGFAAGGGVDTTARLVAQKMQEGLGHAVIVENRPGASGMLGPEIASRSAPDGYTLLYAASGQMTVPPAIYQKMPYSTLRDFVPISMMTSYPLIMITSVNHPASDMKGFIAWSLANPDKVNYASASAAFTLASELFKLKTLTPGQTITFRSSNDSVTNVIGEHVTYAIAEPPPVVPQVTSGNARALAVAAPQRLAELPDVPTMQEVGVDMNVQLWSGLFAPAGTPPEIIKKLEAECIRIAQLPDFKEKLRTLSTDAIGSTSQDLHKSIDDEIKMWSDVAKRANLTFEQ